MSISESDLMLLESYLDDALVEGTIEHLRTRLSTEPELATALSRLRKERAMRQSVFEALEPTDADVQNLIAGIHNEINHQEVVKKRWRFSRTMSAAAACLVLGLIGGMMLRSSNVPPPDSLVQKTDNTPKPLEVAKTETPKDANEGKIFFPEDQKPYQVILTNNTGQIVGVQKFHTPDEAQQFANDLNRWQQQGQQNQPKRPVNNSIKMVSEEQHEF